MGQGFSLTTLSAGSAGIDVAELADLVYEKSMGTARFMKSIRARHQDGVVVVKVAVKPYAMDLRQYRQRIIQERKALLDVPNALAYQRIVETETNGFLVRQYMYSSLYDRMSTRPFLEDIEKKWLSFQLLCGLRDSHARNVYHGDIKTENTLVTSWNWLYLSDFSSSFKPTTLPEDNPADFSYFFDTSGRRTCYLAPERFLAAAETVDTKASVTWAMDVFSAGCVIAELFLESPMFSLSQLFKYRKGEFDPIATHLHRIADQDVRELVTHMIQIDPESRYSAEEYLDFWRKKVFPDYFYSFLHQYIGLVTDPSSGRAPISGANANLGEADERIDRVYYDFDKISYFLGYESHKQTSAPNVPNGPRLDLFPVHLNIPNNEHYVSRTGQRPSDDGTLIFLALVVSSLRNTARATAKLRACDLLLAFSERLTDEAKLDRVLPYLMSLLNDKADIVQVAAIRTITQLMALVTVISPVNAHVFPEYILPRMQICLSGSSTRPSALVRTTYAACLGNLANSASRFLDIIVTLRANNSLPNSDPELENSANANTAFEGLYDNARAEIIHIFERHTKALITDNDSAVKRAFLGSVPELCMFFGTADSNDILLSHLNTYLNDRQWMLKCAFFETIVGVATFLGSTSLEEFILPLMVQALTDPEEYVVQKVIQSFASMAELGLFSRSKTWGLVDIVGRLTMHPNMWIREAAAMFISSSTRFLSKADVQCIILPLIRPYLKSPLNEYSELAILDTLEKPLLRSALDICVTWALQFDRGLFWKPVNQLHTFSLDNSNAIPMIAGKDHGRHALQRVVKNDEDEQWLRKLRIMGMTPEDDFKLLALRQYIWRIAPHRAKEATYQMVDKSKMINLRSLGITPQTVMFNDQDLVEERSRRIDSISDVRTQCPHTIADALLDASMTIDDSVAKRRRSALNNYKARLNNQSKPAAISTNSEEVASPSTTSPLTNLPPDGPSDNDSRKLSPTTPRSSQPVTATNGEVTTFHDVSFSLKDQELPTTLRHQSSGINLMNRKESTKSVPEIGTTSTNAFGRVEGPSPLTSFPSALVKCQETMSDKHIRHKGAHDYTGTDPSILRTLDTIYMTNYPLDIVEFGPMITPSRRRTIAKSGRHRDSEKSWKPEGVLVATFAEHVGPIHHISVAPDHVFFLTGGDDGSVKVWDTARLERNIAHRSRQTHKHPPGAKITALCFVEHTHSFISSASDGSTHVVRVEFATGSGVVRYSRLRLLRTHQLPEDEYAVYSTHFKVEANSVLLLATSRCRVIAIDLRDMDTLYALQNPVRHGMISAVCVDRKRNWAVFGTEHGVVDLWDLRFRVRLRGWGVGRSGLGKGEQRAGRARGIRGLEIHPTRGRGRWICVATGGEVQVWDVEKVVCKEAYCTGSTLSSKEYSKVYTPWLIDEDKPEGMLGRFGSALDFPLSSPSVPPQQNIGIGEPSVTAMLVGADSTDDGRDSGKYGFIITAGKDRKVRFWDLNRVENSGIISGDISGGDVAYSALHPSAGLVVNVERASKAIGDVTRTGNGGVKEGKGDGERKEGKKGQVQPPRSTVISLQQQQLLRSHLDEILDVKLLESPFGMVVSVDRMGVVFVFQ